MALVKKEGENVNFADWYTDTVDIYRITESADGALIEHSRELVVESVPCRIYQTNARAIQPQQTVAKLQQERKLMTDNGVDIRAGDELLLHRGALLGEIVEEIRAFAGQPVKYFEPFGGVMPSMAHQEITLLQEERVR